MKAPLKYYWPAILWALFIFILCVIPLGSVSESPMFFPGFDKLVHCGFFFVFVVFYAYGLIKQHNLAVYPFKYAIIVMLLAMFYGGAIEILQWKVFTWRDGDWNDFFADTVGAGMGTFGVLIISRHLSMIKNRLLFLIFLFGLMVSISSCGIFGKGCGCPSFGYTEHVPASSLIVTETHSCHPGHSEGSSSI